MKLLQKGYNMSTVNYTMNKYRKQLNSNDNSNSTKWTPHYIINLFGMEDYALKESFLNIVAACNPGDTVITDNANDVSLYIDPSVYPDKSYIDVYTVLSEFNIGNPALQHAVKKILMCGLRGHKDKTVDRKSVV